MLASCSESAKQEQTAAPPKMSELEMMPAFPSTPPNPCERVPLNAKLFERKAGAKLGDLDAEIANALDSAGYRARRYFRFRDDGFAIVTQVEAFDKDGRSDPGSRRFVADLTHFEDGDFNLSRYIKALLTGKIGQYRLFVITVTGASYGTDTRKEIMLSEADELWKMGWTRLADTITDSPWSEKIRVEVLVYEIETREGVEPAIRKPAFTGDTHLKKSGVFLKYY